MADIEANIPVGIRFSKIKMKKNYFEKITLFLLLLGVSFSICYWAIAKYDLSTDYRACGLDTQNYIKMSKMEYKDVIRPYRYRVIMPSIVYLLNRYLNINDFLSKYYDDVGKKTIQLNFGIVNTFNLAFTAFLLFYYCLYMGFSKSESLVGSFLYLTSFFVVTYFTVPMIDSLSAFFMLACFYALLKGSLGMLGIAFLLGVFTKESTFAVIPLIMLEKRRFISKELFVCLPGLFLYIIFVIVFKTNLGGNIFSIIGDFNSFKAFTTSYRSNFNLYFIIEAMETFMFLWVLAFYAILKCKVPVFLKRALWLFILPLITAPIVGVPFVGRVTFYLFPIVIPLSLFAFKHIFLEKAVSN